MIPFILPPSAITDIVLVAFITAVSGIVVAIVNNYANRTKREYDKMKKAMVLMIEYINTIPNRPPMPAELIALFMTGEFDE